MQFYEAKVADLLRCHQRDQTFVNEIEDELHAIFKHGGGKFYYKYRNLIPIITKIWYYYMTSLTNIQTLGEEYTGTIRMGPGNAIPSKMAQSLWLILYVGGEPLVDRFLNASELKLRKSTSLTEEAKYFFSKCFKYFKDNKQLLKRLHQSVFYMDGKYYNVSNRLAGIRYVLVRQWLQDDTYTGSFKILGKLSLIYVLFNCVHQFLTLSKDSDQQASAVITEASSNGCILCGDNIKNPCATGCGHIFCWDCIYSSLSYQKFCPICRETVKPNRIIFLQNFSY